jgi:hypothetical protein
MSDNFALTTAGILYHNISDHQPYYVVLDFLRFTRTKCKYVEIRNNSQQAMVKFKNDLANTCVMDRFLNSNDPNLNFNILDDIIQQALERNMPTRYVKLHKHKHKKSQWITFGILRSIKFRDSMYKRLKNTPPSEPLYDTLKVNLRTYNTILRKSIRMAKANYYHSCFEKYKNDIKSTWMTIKEVINRTNKTKKFPESFKINNENVSDNKIIANEFNKYFTQIGPALANNIQNLDGRQFQDYLLDISTKDFSFVPVNEIDVGKLIDRMKPKTSCGQDGISNKLLKHIKSEILLPLTLIINQSILSGIFPNKLKIAKVLPIYKKDDECIFSNYRPVSVLSSVSKVFERVLHDQLYNHFVKNNLFFHSQYGFRHRHSTELAALEVIDRIVCSMDKNELPLNIFLDLSKAFDTLGHQILVTKLQYYGLCDRSISLIRNYLSHREQYVVLNDACSELLPITTGVPQGSILGPLLFIIYLNDLVKACNVFVPVIYADDTALFTVIEITNQNNHDLVININEELHILSSWFKANRLSLNGTKTKAMLFHTKQRKIEPIEIHLDGKAIEFVEEFNYLGINFDRHLSWKSHINKVSKKISQNVGVMTRLKHYMPTYILLTLYNSLVFPYLNYGLLVWGAASHKLEKLQKKAIRVIANAKYNAHTEPLYKNLGLLKLCDQLKLQEYKFLYKLQNELLPSFFQNSMFIRQSDVHDHNTRHATYFRTPQSKHSFVINSIRFRLPNIINECPDIIKQKVLTHSFPGYIKYI